MFEETLSLIDQVSGPAKAMASAVGGLGDSVRSLAQGDLEGAASRLAEMAKGLDEVAPGLGTLASMAIEAAGAVGELVLKGAEFALEVSEHRERLQTALGALGGYADGGRAAIAMLDDMARTLPQSKEQLGAWAKQFQAMGVTDLSALRGQIEATASAQALMGDQGASAYTSLSRKIQESIIAHQGLKISERQLQSLATTGVNVADVAARMGISTDQLRRQLASGTMSADKFGSALQEALVAKGQKPLEQMAGSMSTMVSKLKENFANMFEGVDPSPFTGAMKDLLGIFSQATPSGQAMGAALRGFFNGVFSVASKVLPYLKRFFLDLVIAGLKIYIALKPTIASFKQLFGQTNAGGVFGSMLKVISNNVYLVSMAIAGTIAVFVKMATIGKAVVRAISDAFASIVEVGRNLIDGLIAGITGGVGKVVDSAKNLAHSAMNAIKGVLGISSPSRVMMQFGAHTSGGFAEGIEGGAPRIEASAKGMASAATAGASAPTGGGAASGSASSGGGGINVTVEPGAIVINGAGKDAEGITEIMVSAIFERLALAQGLS